MINFHPDARFLTEYSAGTLSVAQAIAVSVHLEFCPHCRQRLASLNQVGAAMFEQADSTEETVDMSGLDAIFDRIDNPLEQEKTVINHKVNKEALNSSLVNKLITANQDHFSWKKLTKKLAFSRLQSGDVEKEVGLYHIFAGGNIPSHKHKGDEITVVLKGSFSDEDGVYHQGDFLQRHGNETHRPMASQDADCICLAVVDAPVKFTGLLSRFINPFLSINPS